MDEPTPKLLVAVEDIQIVRRDLHIDVLDGDGEHLYSLPLSFTDNQVRAAVNFANKAYDRGYSYGRFRKAAELRAALSEGE